MLTVCVQTGITLKQQRQIKQVQCGVGVAEKVQIITKPTEQAISTAWNSSQEVVQQIELQVEGEYPKWLQGNLYRNGPGEFNEEMTHWFSGYSLITDLQFKDGKAYQQQRKTETQSYKAYKNNGNKLQFMEFGAPVGPLKTFFSVFKLLTGWGQGITDNAGVSVFALDNERLLALTETVPGAYVLKADTLEVVEAVKYKDNIKGYVTTAHPTVLQDGTFLNIVHDLEKGYQIVKWRDTGDKRELVRYVPLELGSLSSWIHDFPATENYVIVPETPMFLNFKAMDDFKYIIGPWQPDLGSIFHVVPLNGKGPTLKLKLPAFFTFHYINAFEFTDEAGVECIAVDVPYYETPDIVTSLLLKNLRDPNHILPVSTLKRIILPLNQNGEQYAKAKIIDLISQEECDFIDLPTINPNFQGREYRYTYIFGAARPTNVGNMVQKLDVQTGQVVAEYHEQGGVMGEPLFVANPGGSGEEDDGVVLCSSIDMHGQNWTTVLDAKTFEVLSQIKMKINATAGFHSCFKFDC